MARGLVITGPTREAAEEKLRREAPDLPATIIDCRPIPLDDVPLQTSLEPHWVIVVEDEDPSKLPQDPNPIDEVTRRVRSMYTTMATDPEALMNGYIAMFKCPACGKEIKVGLPPRREQDDPNVMRARCPECVADLFKEGGNAWMVNR